MLPERRLYQHEHLRIVEVFLLVYTLYSLYINMNYFNMNLEIQRWITNCNILFQLYHVYIYIYAIPNLNLHRYYGSSSWVRAFITLMPEELWPGPNASRDSSKTWFQLGLMHWVMIWVLRREQSSPGLRPSSCPHWTMATDWKWMPQSTSKSLDTIGYLGWPAPRPTNIKPFCGRFAPGPRMKFHFLHLAECLTWGRVWKT